MLSLPAMARLRGARPLVPVLLGLVLTTCSDNAGPTAPAATATGSFEVEMPASVYEGQPFAVTVVAVARDGTKPDPTFTGAVTLSASLGAVSPATLQLAAGVGTGDVVLNGHAGDVTLSAHQGQAAGTAATVVVGNGAVARIEIVPGALLLTAQGESRPLEARAFDAAGRPVRADVNWRSSAAAVVGVDASGTATAAAAVGSAQIFAEADGVRSAPALALIARPVAGAVLVSDAQVVRTGGGSSQVTGAAFSLRRTAAADDFGIEPVDLDAEYGVGWQYRVRLQGVASPESGTILVGSGEAPIGGRVVAAQAQGDEVVVTLELVPIDELFEALEIDEEIALDDAEATLTEEAAAAYIGRRLPDGMLEFVPRSTVAPAVLQGMPTPLGTQDFKIGPLECTSGLAQPLALVVLPTVRLRPSLTDIVSYTTAEGLVRSGKRGTITADLAFEPKLTAQLSGAVDCSVRLAVIPVPIGGPASLFFGANVLLGGGFELKGTTSIANVGAKYSATGTVNVEIGLECSAAGCSSYGDPSGTLQANDIAVSLPDAASLGDQFTFVLQLYPYAWASAAIGSRFGALLLEILELRFGLAQFVDLAPTHAQATRADYASHFRLSALGQLKPGRGITKFLSLFKKTIVAAPLVQVEVELERSPQGTFTIEPTAVRAGTDLEAGDVATFTVTLDAATYLGFDAVERIVFFRMQPDGDGGFTLEDGGLPGCPHIAASPGQTTFTCTTIFGEEDVGAQTIAAFLEAKLFGVPLIVPLEIGKDGRTTVTVTPPGVGVGVAPRTVTLGSSDRQQFSATVAGADDAAVTWRVAQEFLEPPFGTITDAGLYEAPAISPGQTIKNYVIATSVEDPTRADTATVFVTMPSCFPTPDNPCGGGGSSFGDPHLITPDGRAYDFMAIGDFVLARSTSSGGFEVQSRFRRPDGNEEFSWNEAVAMRVGEDVVNVYAADGGIELMINGEDVAIDDGFARQLGAGAVAVSGDTVTVAWADGTSVRVAPARWQPQRVLAFVDVFLPSHHARKVEGLFGNFDGDPTNDLRIRGGATLPQPTQEELYLQFRQSWRIAAGTSNNLFSRDFENWDPFFPPAAVGLDDLDPTAVDAAQTVCRAAGITDVRLFEACIFDVALTGDEEWAAVAAGRDPTRPGIAVVPGVAFVIDSAPYTFRAFVTGPAGQQVTWSASGGTVTPNADNTMTWRAPETGGAYTITATLAGGESATATAHVTELNGPPGYTSLWSGAVDTDWRNGANWVTGSPPAATDNVFIPADVPHQPSVTPVDGTAAGHQVRVYDLLVEEGATVTLSDPTQQFNASELLVGGDLDARGPITGGRVIMVGNGQTVQGTVGFLMIGGIVRLGGPTTVTDSLSNSYEYFGQPRLVDIAGYTMTVLGNAWFGSTPLRMQDPAGRLIIKGNTRFTGIDSNGMLTAGEIHLAGDFQAGQTSSSANWPGSFMATGTKVVLNGTAEQRITFLARSLNGINASHFQDLEITNPSTVFFDQPHWANVHGVRILGDLRITSGGTVTGYGATVSGNITTVPGSTISLGLVRLAGPLGTTPVEGAFSPGTLQMIGNAAPQPQPLRADLAYQNLVITAPTRLIGPTTVAGDVRVGWDNGQSGPLHFDGQTLTVNGGFYTERGGQAIIMTDAADLLIVHGDVDLRNRGTTGNLTAGEIRVSGDFRVIGSADEFQSTGTSVSFVGTAPQSITFQATSFTGRILAHFHDVAIANATGVTLGHRTLFNGAMDVTGGALVGAGSTVTVKGALRLRATGVLTNDGTMTVGSCDKEAGHTINGTDPCP